MDLPFSLPDSGPNHNPGVSSASADVETIEDDDMFSDIALKYINQMLMGENMEDQICMYQESSALQAAEKPFYDILGEKYPPSLDQPSFYVDHNEDSPNDSNTRNHINPDTSCVCNVGEYPSSKSVVPSVSTDYTSQLSFGSLNSTSSVVDGLEESPTNIIRVPDFLSESQPVRQFRRGVEEASKFLPSSNNFIFDVEKNELFVPKPKEEPSLVEVKAEKNDDGEDYLVNGLRGRKNPHQVDLDLEEKRGNKQSAVYSDKIVRSEIFDMVLLCDGGQRGSPLSNLQEALQNGVSKNLQNGNGKVSNGAKSRGKKQGKREVVDLRSLLVQCAQAVAVDDRRTANELLKQIRQHSSPFGDGSQRLAHCFADYLEARLTGTGGQIYTALSNKRTTAYDVLKAYQLYLAACPFRKVSHFFANMTIANAVENATRLHIIDFGIYYGFQWPCVIQRLSRRPGGPPKLRITGIDLPQPGFWPWERVEETGRRLADYASSFNVPFEYTAIAQEWETIRIEDLKLDKDEVLVVNCMYRLKTLVDETVVFDSPRNIVLNTIRKMNPDIFIHGIVNGAYSAPFFMTRFREALFHFSALFDMLETNVPREHPERIVLEREIFGREALNIISCEGSSRVERPETYKQWQVRTLRAGFKQCPLNPDILKKVRDKVKSSYHKDFIIDEDGHWMLQGWKGRIIFAITTWVPDRMNF
ncbi:GRAS family transcription factor [Tasmannia lanceolata]|uniref:GRAS family transcription factor n=1 Tax=Tasmannia lanceolata TaxID=3420 RepID=UPI004064B67C